MHLQHGVPPHTPRAPKTRGNGSSVALLALGLFALGLTACVTVKPQQRSVLADPIMQFEGDPQAAGQLRHAIDNREGSYGGGGVSGGGCGCN